MKLETSAGGIIVQKSKRLWHVLLIKDMNNVWTFPKGRIERGETKKAAAMREIQEEVGLDGLSYVGTLPTVRYTYKRNGLVDKTVHYYLFEYLGRKKPVCQKEEGIKEAKWVALSAASEMVGYPQTNALLLKKTQKILEAV